MRSAQQPADIQALRAGQLQLSESDLNLFFPAHIVIDRGWRILAAGPSLLALMGERLRGANLADHFDVETSGQGSREPCALSGQILTLTSAGPRPVRLRGAALAQGEQIWLLVGHAPAWHEAVDLRPDDFAPSDAAAAAIAAMGRYAALLTESRGLAEALAAQKQAAEAANVAKTTFLATMSHEIRTPMNGVLGLASLLAETELADKQRELVDVIISSGRALMDILNNVLDLSKVEAGRSELETTSFELGRLVSGVHAMFQPQASAKGLALDVEVSTPVPMLEGDPARLRQILLNLIGNALKFTDDGQVVVRACFQAKGKAAGVLALTVSDTGIGMAPKAMDRIFQPFVQADSSTTRRFGGTGLGLSITRRLVDLMGGKIRVESRLGRGTTFRVDIPVRAAPPAPASDAPGGAEPKALPNLADRGHRILVVEDNLTNQFVMRCFLERLGLEADYAADGLEALIACEQKCYDLILMDIELPKLDGIAATREIRRREIGSGAARVPIIALSADALGESSRNAVEAGMDGFVTKPIDMHSLAKVVADAVGGEARNAPALAGSGTGA